MLRRSADREPCASETSVSYPPGPSHPSSRSRFCLILLFGNQRAAHRQSGFGARDDNLFRRNEPGRPRIGDAKLLLQLGGELLQRPWQGGRSEQLVAAPAGLTGPL